MNTFVSGESDAKGLSVILPYIAVDPAAVAIRRPELWERLEFGGARPGMAGRGKSEAWNVAWRGVAGLGEAPHGMARNMARRG